jgi:ketosteroid isomerase-like protein
MRFNPAASRLFLPALAIAFTACATANSPQEGAVVTSQPAALVTPEGTVVPVEIRTVHPAYVTAWRNNDATVLKTYFSDDAVVVTPAGQYTGWTDISTKWILPALPTMKSYSIVPASFTKEGTTIVEAGNYSYVVTENGTPRNVAGTYTYRWTQGSDGVWRLVSVQIN